MLSLPFELLFRPGVRYAILIRKVDHDSRSAYAAQSRCALLSAFSLLLYDDYLTKATW